MTTHPRKLLASILALLLCPAMASAVCPSPYPGPVEGEWPASGPIVRVEMNVGHFYIELYPTIAPQTVAKFLEFANAGLYDGAVFHETFPSDTQLTQSVEVYAGTYNYDGADFNKTALPPTSIPNEACLPNETYSVFGRTEGTFDGEFGIYPIQHSWGDIDDAWIVFGRLVDRNGTPLGAESEDNPIDWIGASYPLDGHLSLDSPSRNALRMLPFDLDHESSLDDQLDLSDLSRCFRDEGQGATTSLRSVMGTQTANFWDPYQVLYKSGPDTGEMVITSDGIAPGCAALLDEVIPLGEITEPVNFDCPMELSNVLWLYNRQNRCSMDRASFWEPTFPLWDLSDFGVWFECFIFVTDEMGNVTEFVESAQSCVGLAVSETLLEVRRAEINTHVPDHIFQILSVPEPSYALLAFGSLVVVAHQRRRQTSVRRLPQS